MISEKEIKNAIYQKYIAPTKRRAEDYVGVEFELPIINLNKQAVNFELVHRLAEAFADAFCFSEKQLDDEGNIFSAVSPKNGDALSFDCSYNTLELSFGKEADLNIIHSRFTGYYRYIQAFLLPEHHTLTGMGINPYREYNKNIPIPSERYRMLLHHLESYDKYGNDFHHYPNFGLFSAANQVQLDVEEEQITEVINTFNKLEPLKSVIFANSPLEGYLCSRDYLWKRSLHGLNPRNVDGYDEALNSVDDVIDYIKNMSIYCVMREGRYINFSPAPLVEYFNKEQINGELWNGSGYETVTFQPQLSDLQYLRSFKFEDLTFRGTVEFRSVCSQPVSEIMTSPAFHAGLIRKTKELKALLDADCSVYQNGLSASELRESFNKDVFPPFIKEEALKALLKSVIDLSTEGLKDRGYDEEHFLEPLYHRIDHLFSPAKQMTDGIKNGVETEYYIKEYAQL